MIMNGDWLAAQWDAAMRESEYFSLDRSTPDQAARHWDILSESFDGALGGDTRRAELAIKMLADRDAINPDTVALDIGCGTGTFALELAKDCRRVFALDYSEGMLKRLREKAHSLGVTNITTVCRDWSAFDAAELPDAVTLSLSCLNTGMRDRASLIKMHEITRGTCCYITSAGAARAHNRNELQEIVLGRTLNNAGGGDIIYPFMILYAMGLYPELSYVPCAWTRALDPQTALENLLLDYGRFLPIDEEKRKKLESFVRARLNAEGKYVESMQSRLGVAIWKGGR